MNAVFEDNGTCLVLLSFLQEEQLEHSDWVLGQLG